MKSRNTHGAVVTGRAGSFGSVYDWMPATNFTSSWFLNGILPWANTDFNGPVAWPNQWAPLNAQAIYTSDLWGTGTNDQRDQFARRTQQMCGAMFSSGLNVESGTGLSRNPPAQTPPEPFDADTKYAIGSLSQAVILRPGVLGGAVTGAATDRGDTFSAIGVVGVGQVSPYVASDAESPGTVPYKRMWTNAVAGGEFIAQVGRRTPIDDDLAQPGYGAQDLRELFLKEEDDWEVQPAGIGMMIGATTSVVIDTKKSEDDIPSNFGFEASCPNLNYPTKLGSVRDAVGVKSLVAAAVRKSWVNTRNTVNFYAVNSYDQLWKKFDDDTCTSERPGSMIRNLFAMYVDRPTFLETEENDKLKVGRGIGVFIDDVQPELLAGSSGMLAPRQIFCDVDWPDCGDHEDAYKEQGSSIVSRGNVIIGDDTSKCDITGWNTDMLHVEGAMRLRGRDHTQGPPRFDACLPAYEKEGILYYDTQSNVLRLGIPGSGGQIDWVALAMNTSDKISAGACSSGERPAQGTPSDQATERHATTEDYEIGVAEDIPPKLTVPQVFTGKDGALAPVTVLASGFMRDKPVFHYLRMGSGGAISPEVDWTKIPGEFVEPVAGLGNYSDAFQISYRMDGPSGSGQRGNRGDTIQLVAFSRIDGRTAGVTFTIP